MMQENEIPSTNNEQSNAATPPKPNKNRRRRSKPKAAPMHSGEDQTAVEQTDNGTAQPNAGENKPKTNNRRRNKAKTQTPSIDGNEPWQRDIKKAIDANQKMHKERLNKASVVEQNSKGKIKITPLGGLGEIGGNICVFETDTSAIVLDVGMSFPSEDMHGVDILVPDFSYLRQIKKKNSWNYYFTCARRSYRSHIVSF